jgi:epsilon-lactone hydrolase
MSWQNFALSWFLRRRVKPATYAPDIDVGFSRQHAERIFAGVRVPDDIECRAAQLATEQGQALPGEWIQLRGTPPAGAATVLFLHGGGYYFCSPRTHRPISFGLARAARARVFSLAYRLAPEHPFPAAVEDALAAYRALLAQGVAAASIVIAGDSAGGGLALALLIAARDAGLPAPAGATVFSPWTDLAATGASLRTNDTSDAMFCGASIGRAARFYLGQTRADHPLASPLYADLHSLPPLLIHASQTEVLRDDALRFARRAEAVGVKVSLKLWPNTPHAHQIFARWLPEARESLADAGRFILDVTEARASAEAA